MNSVFSVTNYNTTVSKSRGDKTSEDTVSYHYVYKTEINAFK